MRIALGIEYDGHGYHGWQKQRGLPTVQQAVEEAISKIANEEISLQCAGRTDAGVHATCQVVHFDTQAKRHIDAWIWGVNSHLPPSIVVRWSRHVDYSFHARFTATARRYRYIIYNHPIRPAVMHNRVTWHYYPLDADLMMKAAPYLLGEQDFSSFRAAECNSKTPMRNVMDVSIQRKGSFVVLEIEANAFLHHMVRNIVGVLIRIGSGQCPPEWMKEVLNARSRSAAAGTASADGLYLTNVRYPEQYDFPQLEHPFLI